MATTDLSAYDPNTVPSAAPFTFGLVVSEWNAAITGNLLEGARETLLKHGAAPDAVHVMYVPGSFELPLGAQLIMENDKVDAVVCIGSVIQGETRHFEFVCQSVAQGVKDVSLKFNKPAIFCVLTDDTLEQAEARSGGKHGNKGVEAAVAAIKMAEVQRCLQC